MQTWTTRPECCEDIERIRAINVAAFPTEEEANLIESLRADSAAWIDGLSIVTIDTDGLPIGHALLSRCNVGGEPALALAPCAVLPRYQCKGVGSAAIRHSLVAAKQRGENLVVVIGHAEYYPRFGFSPASKFGIRAPFDARDEAFLALTLNPSHGTPQGRIRYPAAFGV